MREEKRKREDYSAAGKEGWKLLLRSWFDLQGWKKHLQRERGGGEE